MTQRQEYNGDNVMTTKGYIIGSIIIIGLFVSITFSAASWAMRVSKQTEQNFADAIRTMQGEK